MQASSFKFLLAFVFLLVLKKSYAQDQWVSLYSNTIELTGIERINKLIIPLKLDGVSFDSIRIENGRPLFIRFENKYESKYLEGFKIAKATGKAPAIEITADLEILKAAGTYDGVIVFSATGQKPKEVSISVVRPAATLTSEQAVNIIIASGEVKKSDPIIIKETGKKSNASMISFTSPIFNGVSKDNLVIFPKNPQSIQAGSRTQVIYNPNIQEISNIPLGEYTGKMEIAASELSAPLVVDFKLINKLSNVWIIVIIFLGVVWGAIIRHFVKNRRELAEKRTEAFELLEKIDRETNSIEDPDYKAQIKTVIMTLETELAQKRSFWQIRKGATATLNTLIETTINSYNTAKTAFDTSVKAAVDELKLFSQLFANDDLVPEIQNALSVAKSDYTKAESDLAKRNIMSVNRNLQNVKDRINTFISRYKDSLSNTLASIESGKSIPDMIPDYVKDILKQESTKAKADLQKIEDGQSDNVKLVASIKDANLLQFKINQLLNRLKDNGSSAFQKVYNEGTDLMKKFKAQFDAWHASVQKTKDDPIAELDLTPLLDLNKTWEDVKKTLPTRLGDKPPATPPGSTTDQLLQTRVPSFKSSDFVNISFTADQIARNLKDEQRNWFFYAVIQTVFVFALLALAAYKFYAPNFIGKFDEIIGLFLAAFTMDVTVDNVIQLRDKK